MVLPLFDFRTFIWVLFAFLFGAFPFAVWLTSLSGTDVRAVGDRNPGATNALKAGGWKNGLAVLFLDVTKAALPVGAAHLLFDYKGPGMLAIAMAPMIGHAYSPFLNFKGGKAVATALGVWIGLTLWEVPLVAIIGLVFWFALLRKSGWAVLLTLLGIAGYLLLFRPELLLLEVLALQIILLIWKHRFEFRLSPRPNRR